jgi:ABC-type branched-subunit amino acid transport system substrate-binding protein
MNSATKEKRSFVTGLPDRRSVVAFLALAAIVPAFGCAPSKAETVHPSARIGVIAAATGMMAAFGQAHQRGYAIALEEINAEGGVFGRPLVLDFYDDQGKPDIAIQGASKLVDQDHVPIVIGSGGSETALALVPVMTSKQVPLVVSTATADNILEQKSPWVFRLCAGSSNLAAALVDFLKNHGAPFS